MFKQFQKFLEDYQTQIKANDIEEDNPWAKAITFEKFGEYAVNYAVRRRNLCIDVFDFSEKHEAKTTSYVIVPTLFGLDGQIVYVLNGSPFRPDRIFNDIRDACGFIYELEGIEG